MKRLVNQLISKGRRLWVFGVEFVRQEVWRKLLNAVRGKPRFECLPEPAAPPLAQPLPMTVRAVPSTLPTAFGMTSEILVDHTPTATYQRVDAIDFGPGDSYSTVDGIVTFRGNNYRDKASFGRVDPKRRRLDPVWVTTTGRVEESPGIAAKGRGYWTGSGWTGQPLIVKWPEDIKRHLNITPEKKADPELVEVIYACMDGVVYFLDLRDGTPTRPPIKTGGGPIKGTASIYPDGTPMLFVGPADDPPGMETVRARLYSLIDQRQLFTFGQADPDAPRVYHSYDSSPLFAADTIIAPGENGLIYTIKLNTRFDRATGELTVDPEPPVKLRYTAPGYADAPENTPTTRWLGMEDSACAWRGYIYIADNGGRLMCVDVNTMQMIWVQDTLDDTNTSPVLEECPEDGTAYLYISTSLHINATGMPNQGDVPIWKLDAATGEVVWTTKPYHCYSFRKHGVSGGVQATPVLGRGDIAGLVIYPIAHSPAPDKSLLVALDKRTGAEVWRVALDHYCWSSPVAVYTPAGKSYIIQCDSYGYMYLLDGATGKILHHAYLWKNVEASPAVYGNTIVVGTRGAKIYGVRLS